MSIESISSVPPRIWTLSACAVGFILIDETASGNEQNALGNWLMLASQVVCTNAAFKQYQTGLNNKTNKTSYEKGYMEDKKTTVDMLEKLRNAIDKEIESLNKNLS